MNRQQMRGDTRWASRGFFLLWLLAFVKSFSLVCQSRLVGLFTPATRMTRHANDFTNAKSYARLGNLSSQGRHGNTEKREPRKAFEFIS